MDKLLNDGFTFVEDIPLPARGIGARSKWAELFDALIASGRRGIAKDYGDKNKLKNAYRDAYQQAWRHYRGKISVCIRGTSLYVVSLDWGR